eukprot:gene7133-7938_t
MAEFFSIYSNNMKQRISRNLMLVIVLLTALLDHSRADRGEVSLKVVKYWAELIGNQTLAFSDGTMETPYIRKEYESKNMEINRVNGTELAAELASKVEQFFSWKIRALRILAEKAQKAEKDYIDVKDEAFTYFAAKKLERLDLDYDAHFGVPINTSASVVHIPTEVYDRAPKVARDIKWTKNLNKVFKDNFAMFPDLSWQYFGSAEGIHRQYPARSWPVAVGVPDLYDARRRPWYIQGASSPKDVVILIDRSGSLLGLRTQIAKLAASVIVDTLSTNDFFHVVLFNNESKLICCEDYGLKLLQATRRNKEYVKNKLRQWKSTSTANWKAGLEMAFKILERAKQRNEGTQCQQALLILSDGSASYEKEIFNRYNSDKSIRVFTFVVGPPQYRVQELTDMACKNKGYFLRIPSVGTVWETVTSYIRVLSRPVGVDKVKPTSFTSVFVDATGGGLVSTGSTPVFRNANTSDSELLGVMATDVPVKDMNEFIYYPLMGHNGYVFTIDNNGLVLIHPGINEDKLGKLSPQPNMDVDQLEFSTEDEIHVEQLRESMIRHKRGTKIFEAYIKSKDDMRVQKHLMQYHYFRTQSSPFSIGLASHDFGYSIRKPVIDFQTGKKSLETVQQIKGWPFCSKVWNHRNLKETLTKILEKAIKKGETSPSICDARMLNGLLFDSYVTRDIDKVWKMKEKTRQEDDVINVFLRTHFGAIRSTNLSSLPYSEGGKRMNFTQKVEFDYYERSVQQKDHVLTLTVSTGKNVNAKDRVLSIYSPIRLSRPAVTVAVAGLEMNYTRFADKYFVQQTKHCPDGQRCDVRLTCDRTQKNKIEGLYCYLLDENGFVVASNEKEDVGDFFGSVDSKVMEKLILNKSLSRPGIYHLVTLPDYQASCKLMPNRESSADRLLSPLWSLSRLVSWFSTATVALLNLGGSFTNAASEENVKYINCIKNNFMYLADKENSLSFLDNATCGRDTCIRSFAVSRVKKTNLFLLAIESKCGKCKSSRAGIKELPGIPGEQQSMWRSIVFENQHPFHPSDGLVILCILVHFGQHFP